MTERKLKTRKRDKPVEMVKREDYEEMISLFKDIDELFSKMNWSPEAKNIHNLQCRVQDVLDRHEG